MFADKLTGLRFLFNSMDKKRVVIVGGGPGGYSAAFLAADLGMKVTLIDEKL